MGQGVGTSIVKLQTLQDPAGEKENRNKPFTAEADGSVGLSVTYLFLCHLSVIIYLLAAANTGGVAL